MRNPFTFFALVAACLALPGVCQDAHLSEAGSGVIQARSAFAHGYRHGYEEGYHQGNVDINMGRIPRPLQKGQLRGLKLKPGYSPSFGSKRSFEDGFEAGLRAGYRDGFAGRPFRALGALRLMAAAMESTAPPSDPGSIYFDSGLATGYRDGWRQGASSSSSAQPGDPGPVECKASPAGKVPAASARDSYCDGYRRGYILGKDDSVVLHRDLTLLEASK